MFKDYRKNDIIDISIFMHLNIDLNIQLPTRFVNGYFRWWRITGQMIVLKVELRL